VGECGWDVGGGEGDLVPVEEEGEGLGGAEGWEGGGAVGDRNDCI
jgi:hypothetical protein